MTVSLITPAQTSSSIPQGGGNNLNDSSFRGRVSELGQKPIPPSPPQIRLWPAINLNTAERTALVEALRSRVSGLQSGSAPEARQQAGHDAPKPRSAELQRLLAVSKKVRASHEELESKPFSARRLMSRCFAKFAKIVWIGKAAPCEFTSRDVAPCPLQLVPEASGLANLLPTHGAPTS